LTTDDYSFGQTGFKIGGLIDFDQLLVDGSVLLRINSATRKTTPPSPLTSSEVAATGTEFAINARAFMRFTDKFAVVPIFRLSTFGYEPEISATPTPAPNKPNDYGRTDFELGVGSNITLGTGKVFAGVSFETISLTNNVTSKSGTGTVTTNNTATLTSLPKVNFGAEFDISSYITLRTGYFKAFSTLKGTTEPPSPGKTETMTKTYDYDFCPPYGTAGTEQLLSFGLGIHYDRFNIDGYLNEQWLAEGINVLSGQANAMFGVLSLSYNFN
jgi:hypothetical protein